MNSIFELRAWQAALTVSRPSPDRRETTTITTSVRKSKYKSTENAGARQPSCPKKQKMAVGKHVFVERKGLKYLSDPTSGTFSIVELNSLDKLRFFGSVVGKANKLYMRSLIYCHPLLTKFQLAGHLLKFWLQGRRKNYTPHEGRQRVK